MLLDASGITTLTVPPMPPGQEGMQWSMVTSPVCDSVNAMGDLKRFPPTAMNLGRACRDAGVLRSCG